MKQQKELQQGQNQTNQSQPNWLKVTIITTIVGGVVQVIVNHFDSIISLLGGTFSHIHLSVDIIGVTSTISAITTIGGAVATLVAYRIARKSREAYANLRRINEIASKALERLEE